MVLQKSRDEGLLRNYQLRRVLQRGNKSRQLFKQNVAYLNNQILFNNEKDEILIHVITQMNLKNVMLTKRNQTRKTTYVA